MRLGELTARDFGVWAAMRRSMLSEHWCYDALSVVTLCRSEGVTESGVGVRVSLRALVRAGMVTVEGHPEDRRKRLYRAVNP